VRRVAQAHGLSVCIRAVEGKHAKSPLSAQRSSVVWLRRLLFFCSGSGENVDFHPEVTQLTV
ncbi:hypothetical protein, partial [Pseudomonas aeruginosa]|uniref:hypothetical protein n=1 Tax=Pseudomonas aeruginosa TaxID=287 RepID=UPI001C43E9D0